MKFDLTTPCAGEVLCPFRTDCLEGWLGEDRAMEIADSLSRSTFGCHKTTVDGVDDDGWNTREHGPDTQHCAGALIVLEKMEQPSQMMRIAERLGMYDMRKLKMDAPVFANLDDFISHHA